MVNYLAIAQIFGNGPAGVFQIPGGKRILGFISQIL
jgi:hypothetical protein